MSEYNVASLNGKDYIEADTVNFRDNTYVFLVNEKDEKDFLVRKITSERDKTFYEPLETKEEFEVAMLMFTKKHKEVIENI